MDRFVDLGVPNVGIYMQCVVLWGHVCEDVFRRDVCYVPCQYSYVGQGCPKVWFVVV